MVRSGNEPHVPDLTDSYFFPNLITMSTGPQMMIVFYSNTEKHGLNEFLFSHKLKICLLRFWHTFLSRQSFCAIAALWGKGICICSYTLTANEVQIASFELIYSQIERIEFTSSQRHILETRKLIYAVGVRDSGLDSRSLTVCK